MNRFRQLQEWLAGRNSYVHAIGLSVFAGAFVLLTHRMVPFSNDGHCDPWHYFGYFYLDDQFAMMGDSRTYSRLPLTFVGFVLTRLLRSVSADYAHFLILLVIVAGSVFVGAERLFGRFAATVATFFVTTSGIVIGVLSVTYTGPTLAWDALAIAAAILAADASHARRRRLLLVVAGFFWGTAIIGHLYSVTYNFVLPLYCLTWRSLRLRPLLAQLLSALAYLAIGIALSVLVFGVLSKFVLHAEFTFFRHQFLEVLEVSAAGYTRAVTSFFKPGWYLTGGKAALVGFGLVLSLASLATAGSRPGIRRVNIALAVLLTVLLAYTFVGGVTLQYDYYYVWMMPSLALSVASVVSRWKTSRERAIIYGAAYALLALAGTLAGYETVVRVASAWPSAVVATFAAIAFVALVLRPSHVVLAMALASLAVLGITIRPERMGVQVWDGSAGGAEMYRRVRQGWEFLSQFHFPERPIFWLAAQGKMSESIAYPRGFEYCHVDTALPHFLSSQDEQYDPRAEVFRQKRYLVMVVPDDAVMAGAIDALRLERGLQFEELARKAISSDDLSYSLVIGRLHVLQGTK